MIRIVEYDPAWAALFDGESARLTAAIGPWVSAIEHIGSTAVPGLAAKPCIDIMVGLRTLDDAVHCIEPVTGLGYDYVPEYEDVMPYRRYFKRTAPPGHLYHHSHHIHMAATSHPFWARHLDFRDYLRAHPDQAAAYAALKRDLAAHFGDDHAGYTDAKTEFITALEAQARAWRGAGGK
jgi:GrpB-like predicted nucleotidyltransferase (UPF0157 family)